MGCGTGQITKYIVGPDGQVVGIDPDAARIKIAGPFLRIFPWGGIF